MNKSESIVEIAQALLVAQSKMPSIKKSADNPFFKSKYAPLDKVMPVALKALNDQKIAVTQLISNIDGQSALTTLLMHSSGEWISADQPLILDKDNPQGQASAVTYARRYAIMAALGMVADEDDDGNKASNGQVNSNRPATSKQVVYITTIAQRAHSAVKSYDPNDIGNWIIQVIGKSAEQLQMGEVDKAIEKLKEAGKELIADSKEPKVEDEVIDLTAAEVKEGVKGLENGTIPF